MLRPRYPLLTERLLLRPFRDEDLDALSVIEGDAATVRYLYSAPRSRAAVRVSLIRRRKMTAIEKEGDAIRLAATLRDAGTLVGDVSLHYRSREHRLGEIGFVLHPEHRGHGYATETGLALSRWAFEQGIEQVIALVRPANTRAMAMVRRIGMEWVGETEKYHHLRLQQFRLRPADITGSA